MSGDNIDEEDAEVIDIGDLLDGDLDEDPIPESLSQPYDDDEIPVARARFKKPVPEKKGGALKAILIVLAILLIGSGAGIVLAKKKIIEIYPPAKELYIKAGMYHAEPGERLAPRDVKPRRDVRNGVELLIVEGNVVNITEETLDVPPLKVSLTNPQGKDVASQIIELHKKTLKPADTVSFKVEFENPPGTARQMSVKFVAPEAPADAGDHAGPAQTVTKSFKSV